MKHSGKDDVGDEGKCPGALVREVETSHGLAYDGVIAWILDRRAGIGMQCDLLAGEQLGVVVLGTGFEGYALTVCEGDQLLVGGSRRTSDERALHLDRFAACREALVWGLTGIALHVADLGSVDVQLFGHDLRECCLDARADLHFAAEEGDVALVIDREPCIVLRGITACDVAQDRELRVEACRVRLLRQDGSDHGR